MRFMMMVKADDNYEAGRPPDPKLMEAIGQHTEEMVKKGIVLETGGLLPSAKGARIRAAGGKLTVIDGPFAEAKELIGGYAILKASSKDEAIRLGSDFMKLHQQVLGPAWQGELEVRQLAEFGCE
jgi:hypothetical protein